MSCFTRIFLFTVSMLISITFTACSNDTSKTNTLQLSEELTITEIEKETFLITHSFPWPGNSLIVVLDKKNILLIDTPYTPEATSLVLDWIQKKLGKDRSITAINTGFHIDNLGGNEALIKRNIPIYGSGLTVQLIETKSADTMKKMITWLSGAEHEKYRNTYSNFKFFSPTRTFNINEEQKLRLGSEEVIIFYPGPTHTYDNIVVYIPGKQLLFGGCMILSSDTEKPGYVDDGNPDEWANSLLQLEKRFEKIRLVVPGHGEADSKMLITHTKQVVSSYANKSAQ